MTAEPPPAPSGDPPLGPKAAAAIVFGASAAVLVVEVVALRLLAPYLGLTLETSTLVIGIALAAIALGAWGGGRAADVVPPRRALGPLLGVSGAVVAVTPVAVRWAGAVGSAGPLMLVATLMIMVPGALLSAVSPMVTKLRLTDLSETGRVVGKLSGVGTAGAIVGTVVTGFVLISRVPVTGIMVGLGVALVLAAATVQLRTRGPRAAAVPAVGVIIAGGLAGWVPAGCDVETAYHCAVIRTDPQRSTGRTLVLDGASHSYVDLADSSRLEFDYAKTLAVLTADAYPSGRPVAAYHLGGGGLTLPRYLAQTRPGSTQIISEIDPGVVRINTERLGFDNDPAIEVRTEDGRLGARRLPTDSQDLVIGDAFGGVSVPWHLTTAEAVGDLDRVLRPDGVYALNLLDYGDLGFARAEVATLRTVFDEVVLATQTDTLTGGPDAGGNLVVVASDRPVVTPTAAAEVRRRVPDWSVLSAAETAVWVGDAPVLTDDYAPVDQLLTPYATR